MKIPRKIILPLLPLLAACTPQKYYWGDYSNSLYGYYADPSTEQNYEKALVEVTSAERLGKEVPPGLYAEYGYEELTHGDVEKAVAMFEREKQAWPESAVFMDKAIAAARLGQKSAPNPEAAPASKAPTS
jgi:hypothetical protein